METFKNSYKVEEKRLASLSVCNVGFQRCEPLYQWGPGVRDHYLIHYIVSGKGYFEVSGERYDLSSGDSFLVYPGATVTYCSDEADPWEYYWVGFTGSEAPSLLAATDFSHATPVLRGQDLKDSLYRIYEARGNTYENAVRMAGELYITLAELISQAAEHADIKPYDYSYVQRAVDFIATNYSYPITVDSVAEYVGISRSQLFREFKKYLSISPKEYLTDYRIGRACALLSGSNLSITAISYSIGYDNSMYFSKVFRKAKGVTPSEYISEHRK